MIAVDTNVLIHAANGESEHHHRCVALLQELAAGTAPWCITWNIVYEFLRVTTHPRVMKRPLTLLQANEFITAVLAAANCHVLMPTVRHAQVLSTTIGELPDIRGNIVFDLRTAVLMREHGVQRIYTFDGDFRRFPFLDMIVVT